jgi:2-phosphoglycolate phosphatase
MHHTAMQYKAVLFDLDGTLVDSYAAIAASVNHVRARRGLPALTVDEVKRHVGRGPEHLLRHTVPGGDYEADLTVYRAHHPTVMGPLTQLLPGAAATLEHLHRKGVALGLCSNKPRLFSEALLQQLGIAEYFRVVVGPEDVANLKPAPDMLLVAMRRLGVEGRQTLYIGDMTVDIETGRAAGVTVWVVATGSEPKDALVAAKPERVLDRLDEELFANRRRESPGGRT